MTAKSFPPVNTQEIYGYRPGSTKVHRITDYETGRSPTGATPVTIPMAATAGADDLGLTRHTRVRS